MKKLLSLLIVIIGVNINAQTSIGAGFFTGLDGGGLSALEINSEFALADGQYSISPSLDYYMGLSDKYETGDLLPSSLIGINVDAHYNLGDFESVNYYPLVGIRYQMGSLNYPGNAYLGLKAQKVKFNNFGFSLGGGLTYSLSGNLKIIGEVKYLIIKDYGGLGILTGLLINIGG